MIFGILCFNLNGNSKTFVDSVYEFFFNLKKKIIHIVLLHVIFVIWFVVYALVFWVGIVAIEGGPEMLALELSPLATYAFYGVAFVLALWGVIKIIALLVRFFFAYIHSLLSNEQKIWRDAKHLSNGHKFSYLISFCLCFLPMMGLAAALMLFGVENEIIETISMIIACPIGACASLIPFIYYQKMVALDVSNEQAQESTPDDNRLSGSMPEGTVGV